MPRRGAARGLSATTAKMDDMAVITDSLVADLDDEQREAVLAPRGPVCVLAGAGTGKTRTITHRIAQLVATGHVAAGQVLAVTFTQRAAGEMRSRLRALGAAAPTGSGVGAVQALTFHAAARRQLRYFWPRVVGDTSWQLLETKFAVVARGASSVRLQLSTDDVRDVAGEIEWAKASLISPEQYPDAVAAAGRDIPLDATQVATVYAAYESLKSRGNDGALLDFDDLLLHTAAAIEDDAAVAGEFRDRYRCFVVDEYQDVTPLQQRVLSAWLGDRDDLTVVGDANQTIYSFTGASPRYLLDFSRRFPEATVVRLERDYRSTPQVVSLANRVIAAARGRVAGQGAVIAIRAGQRTVVRVTGPARRRFRFLPGFNSTNVYPPRSGLPGLTLGGCPSVFTMFWQGYISTASCVPLVVQALPHGRPVRVTLSASGHSCRPVS